MKDNHFTLFKSNNGYWYYYFYYFGKRIKKSTNERKRADAMDVVLQRLSDDDLMNAGKKNKPLTFAEFAEGFWNYDTCPIIQDKIQRGGTYAKHSAAVYESRNNQEYIPQFGKKFLFEITNSMIRNWHRNLPQRLGIKAKTANDYLTSLRMMFEEAVRQNLINHNPCEGVKPLIEQAKIRGCYSQNQIQKIFAEDWDSPLEELGAKLAATTGMRLGEVIAFCKEQIHEGYIVVDRSFNTTKEGLKKTKSGKSRIVPILPEIEEELRSVPVNGPFIFSYDDGKNPMNKSTMAKKLINRLEACGIDSKKENLTFHSFRHYFNTRLVASGIESTKIRSVVGHESEQMTEHYLHLSSADLDCVRQVQGMIIGKTDFKLNVV